MKSPIYEAALRGSRCGCPSCGRVFASLAAFDRHRQPVYYATDKHDTSIHPIKNHCIDPLDLGMQVKPHPTEIVYQLPPAQPNQPDPSITSNQPEQ